MRKLTIMLACAAVLFGAGEDIKKLQDDCNGGNVFSCGKLGAFYQLGQGIKQDYKKASELFSKACDMGYGESCVMLGFLYNNGQGVEQDYKKGQ
jgi:beta-lactamase hcpA